MMKDKKIWMKGASVKTDAIISWLERSCIGIVKGIFAVILVFLAVISLVVTCVIYGSEEVVEYLPDSPLLHGLVFILVLGIGVQIRKIYRILKEILKEPVKFRRFLFAAAGIMVIWLMLTCFWPGSDQRMAFESARALLRGDYSPWQPIAFTYGSPMTPRGYAYTYPSQNGLILFFSAVTFFFGEASPYVLQFFNVIFLAAGIFFLCRLFREIGILDSVRGLALLMMGYLPFAFYITFVYGTIPGFFCSAAALYYEQRFIKERKKWELVVAAFLISAAVLLKSNYLIVLVAMVIYLLSNGIFKKKGTFILAAFFLLVIHVFSGRGMNFFLEKTTSYPVSKGAPMIAWVEMGLQEGTRGPGWYNGYHIRVFSEHHSDPEKTSAAVKEDLKETLREFTSKPLKAADFFIRKAESIWAEPTFQSLWIQEVKGDSWIFPRLTQSLFERGGILNALYLSACNYMQTLVYLGTILFLGFCWKKITWEQLLPGIIFIGGFLFHMVWEAKGQYSVCYFIILIPYAFAGIKLLCIYVLQQYEKKKHTKDS